MKSFIPSDLSDGEIYAFFTSAVVPRPIALVSTINGKGIMNLAPFSYCNMVSTCPPIFAFAPVRIAPEGQRQKDTYENLKSNKECVIHFCDFSLVHKINQCAVECPPDISEFEYSGLTPLASELVKPYRVLEASIAFECKLLQIIELGTKPRAGSLMLCEIIKVHIQKDILDEGNKVSPEKHEILARLGGNTYANIHPDSIITLDRARYIKKD